MGEVGAESPTTTTTPSKLNGETNGNCEEEEEEPMEVDGDGESDTNELKSAGAASPESTTISSTKDLIKNGINKSSSKEQQDNDKHSNEAGDSDKSEGKKSVVSNGGKNANQDDVVHSFSEDSDEDDDNTNDVSNADVALDLKAQPQGNKNAGDDDEDDEDDDDDVEAMEVDGGAPKPAAQAAAGTATSSAKVSSSTNNNNNKKIVIDDDDKPVSIHSDSDLDETEDENSNTDSDRQKQQLQLQPPPQDQPENLKKTSTNTNNSNNNNKNNGTCDSPDIQEILSDKEDDCVVIEDKDLDSPRRSSRHRKNVVNVSEFQHYNDLDDDDDDDDVEEVIEDPLKISPVPPLLMKNNKSRLLPNPVLLKDSMMGKNYPEFIPQNFKNHFNQLNNINMNSNNNNSSNKKDPSLVIIDTNTIMAQRTMNANNSGMNNNNSSSNSNNTNLNNNNSNNISSLNNFILSNKNNSLSVVPIGIPAQGVYPVPARHSAGNNSNLNSNNINNNANNMSMNNFQNAANRPISHQNLLPALTDDMFVLEAPSFIVPYIYEKPPSDNLKEIVTKMAVELEEINKKLPSSTTAAAGETASTEDAKKSTAEEDGKKEGDDKKDKKRISKRQQKNPDDSWDESDTSTDDEASDSEQRTKILIKEVKEDIANIITPEAVNKAIIGGSDVSSTTAGGTDPEKKSDNFFDNPLGKFFMNIGVNLVQEYVQTDLLRIQKRKRDREGKEPSSSTQMAINSLMKNLELSKENNEPFKFELKRCEYCAFKSESSLAMAHHYETPHMRNYIYKCNFCSYETRPPHDILYHMEAVHNIKGRLEKAPAYHQCPNCTFEDNGKSKLARHSIACIKKFRPEVNLCPPIEWEPPAKIPRIKPKHGLVGTATAYQAMAAQQRAVNIMPRTNMNMNVNTIANNTNTNANINNNINNNNNNNNNSANNAAAIQAAAALRARGRPQTVTKPSPAGTILRGTGAGNVAGMGIGGVGNAALAGVVGNMANNQNNFKSQLQSGNLLQNNIHFAAAALAVAGNQFLQQVAGGLTMLPNNQGSLTIQSSMAGQKQQKPSQQPSISITPLPRQPSSSSGTGSSSSSGNHSNNFSGSNNNSKMPAGVSPNMKPGQSPNATGKSNFVICEICDGYIKDLDQLRNHMQWIHKVKIHPKMIYNRPPLNCQKCQFRFFTDQGLERHLLGSHGLVTSSMQEAANKGKDAGRCPVCGRVYQWKLLNHVSRDHDMTLKPAHLSYKCTVCTATFGMYKQFESHVYSAHSTVAKKAIDNKNKNQSSSSSNHHNSGSKNSGDSLLKPLKINDEITIIPQPSSHHKLNKLNNSGPIEIE